MKKLDYFKKYLVYFILLSIMGWIWEVLFHLLETGAFVNRGMFHGPWVPLYGWGGLLIIVVLNRFKSKPFIVFTFSMLMCGILEYVTGTIVEKCTGSRWWDYSEYMFNINGRVCLYSLLLFGILGFLIIKFFVPIVENNN